jgi:hypothetical protein
MLGVGTGSHILHALYEPGKIDRFKRAYNYDGNRQEAHSKLLQKYEDM